MSPGISRHSASSDSSATRLPTAIDWFDLSEGIAVMPAISSIVEAHISVRRSRPCAAAIRSAA